jgi:hypothetical protein
MTSMSSRNFINLTRSQNSLYSVVQIFSLGCQADIKPHRR